MSGRDRHSSGSPHEAAIGLSRAVRVGDRIVVSGTGPVEPDGSSTSGLVGEQAERVLTIIAESIEALGGTITDIVPTRLFLIDAADADAVGAVHARWFAAASPAATMVVVAALLRPEWRVEIEAEAVLGSTSCRPNST